MTSQNIPSLDDERAVKMLGALAQSTRLKIFRTLMSTGEAGMPAGKIAEELGQKQNTLSSHLNILLNAELLQYRRDGRHLIYSVKITEMGELISYLVNNCCNGDPEICGISLKRIEP
ncbi:transcriptional regulator [Pseudovibrio japonicus]|uniref:Transcriptional regulator n=1 Tax=Pseudovibrio japonicus TaxID=366534 RepID=A0ABQ3EC05_9HYPH|nr:metalloregulator ArsR/SmtB family transcription factor [Pseudovibrio japonicus]GHB29932.1 transcriptional regulator [Pseudovibrio japonicus]